MKTLSQIFILSVLSLAAFVACGKKKSDSAPVAACSTTTALPPGQYCNNGALAQAQPCVPNQVPTPGYMCMNGYLVPNNMTGAAGNLLNNVQMANSHLQGAVNLSGTGNYDFNNPRIAYSYGGQVSVTGVVQITSQALCGAPMGTYQISGAGNMMYGAINNMTMTLSGPSTLQLMISSAVLDNPTTGLDRNSNDNRLGILMSTLIVNGQPCGTITTY